MSKAPAFALKIRTWKAAFLDFQFPESPQAILADYWLLWTKTITSPNCAQSAAENVGCIQLLFPRQLHLQSFGRRPAKELLTVICILMLNTENLIHSIIAFSQVQLVSFTFLFVSLVT